MMVRMKQPRRGSGRNRSDTQVTTSITFPADFYRKMRKLSLTHDKSVSELVQHAIEMHYSDAASSARHRLIDRLARLEADIGDPETLFEQISEASRVVKAR